MLTLLPCISRDKLCTVTSQSVLMVSSIAGINNLREQGEDVNVFTVYWWFWSNAQHWNAYDPGQPHPHYGHQCLNVAFVSMLGQRATHENSLIFG